jgi:CheY-like chemotaxis protein
MIQADPGLAPGSSLIMLTSAGQMGDAARCRELGISGYLGKPIRQQELMDAITCILKNEPMDKPQLVTRHSLRESRSRARILLAEDNAINQKLALRLLEKRGYIVAVAETGHEAVQALEKERFDLILMDIQMPEMNGLEATAAIREKEKISGAHIPIIAMTANALKGDEELCLAAGMDGYISKPIRTEELFATIETLLRRHAHTANSREPATLQDAKVSPIS